MGLMGLMGIYGSNVVYRETKPGLFTRLTRRKAKTDEAGEDSRARPATHQPAVSVCL